MNAAANEASGLDIAALMDRLGREAAAAASVLALASTATKNAALAKIAVSLRARAPELLAANAKDLEAARAKGLSGAMLDRLALDAARIESMARGVEEIAALADPIGATIAQWTRPNGLDIARVRVPLGVIGIIYESRPNVTCDAGSLCLKSGNAAILRGGSESVHSSRAIHACLVEGLLAAGLPAASIQLVPTTDRAAVGYLLSSMTDYIDVVVPRGGKSLVARVQQEARVPVIGHLEGVCHVFVDRDADLDMARAIVKNAKLRRTGVCGSAETVLIDAACAATHLAPVIKDLLDAGCEVRGDAAVQKVDARVVGRHRAGLVHRISRRHHRRARGRRRGRRHRAHRQIRLGAHRQHRHRECRPPRSDSSSAWTAPSCCTTPPRSSPTAASSAWARRSASPPIASMRAGRWGWSSSRRTNTWCGEVGR